MSGNQWVTLEDYVVDRLADGVQSARNNNPALAQANAHLAIAAALGSIAESLSKIGPAALALMESALPVANDRPADPAVPKGPAA